MSDRIACLKRHVVVARRHRRAGRGRAVSCAPPLRRRARLDLPKIRPETRWYAAPAQGTSRPECDPQHRV